jgi:hypothetical protein
VTAATLPRNISPTAEPPPLPSPASQGRGIFFFGRETGGLYAEAR